MKTDRISRRAVSRVALVVASVATLGTPLAAARAQSMATLRGAKTAAQNAAAATNAHTAAMTASQDAPAAAPNTARQPAANGAAGSQSAKTAAAGSAGAPRYAATAANARTAKARAAAAAASPPSVAVTETGAANQITFTRETFEYGGRGRRDPFVSLMATGELRPLLSDLKLVTVLYDPTGRNSVAIMRDLSTKDQYRVKVGQTLGRMRVSQIRPKEVVFAIEEFGYGRQEVLGLTDSTTARKQ